MRDVCWQVGGLAQCIVNHLRLLFLFSFILVEIFWSQLYEFHMTVRYKSGLYPGISRLFILYTYFPKLIISKRRSRRRVLSGVNSSLSSDLK